MMRISQRQTIRHLFICCNTRECGDYCSSEGAESLVKELKMKLKDAELWDQYKVSKAGCLGPCANGISAILFPENKLITDLTQDHVQELYDLLLA